MTYLVWKLALHETSDLVLKILVGYDNCLWRARRATAVNEAACFLCWVLNGNPLAFSVLDQIPERFAIEGDRLHKRVEYPDVLAGNAHGSRCFDSNVHTRHGRNNVFSLAGAKLMLNLKGGVARVRASKDSTSGYNAKVKRSIVNLAR